MNPEYVAELESMVKVLSEQSAIMRRELRRLRAELEARKRVHFEDETR